MATKPLNQYFVGETMTHSNYLRIFIILSLLPLLLTACSNKKEEGMQMPPPLVGVMTVERKNHPLTFTFVGEAIGSDSVEIMAQVTGVLLKKLYNEGTFVEKGQALYQIEPNMYVADLDKSKGVLAQSEAELVNAKLNFDRMSSLYKSKSVSQADYDKARASYDSAKALRESASADVQAAQIRLNYTDVIAPVAGYTGISAFTEGNLITTGARLTNISQTNPIDVAFAISDNDFDMLRILGEKGLLEITDRHAELQDSFGNKLLGIGDIYVVEKTVNKSTGDIKARARFANEELKLMPGQFVRVFVNGYFLKDVIMIPFQSVIQTQAGPMVVAVDEKNIANYKPVKILENFEQLYLIESGLEVGERIILEGANKVRTNSPVTIAAPKQPAN